MSGSIALSSRLKFTQDLTSAFVSSIYAQVKQEVLQWHRTSVEDALSALKPVAQPDANDNSELFENMRLTDNLPFKSYDAPVPASEDILFLFVTEYPEDNGTPVTQWLPLQMTTASETDFPPSPPYESCTPIERNIFRGDDPNSLAFLPSADDLTFDPQDFLEMHKELGWLRPQPDPIAVFAFLETVARVQELTGASIEDIKNISVLPWSFIDQEGIKQDLLMSAKHRDLPDWPGPSPARLFERSENSRAPDCSDSYARISSFHRHFCPRLSCLHMFCLTHEEDPEQSGQMRLPTSLKYATAENFRSTDRTPCDFQCFLLEDEKGLATLASSWTAEELLELRGYLRVDPDMFPCDLAIFMARPCREVFLIRDSCLPDMSHLLPLAISNQDAAQCKQKPKPKRATSKLVFRGVLSKDFAPLAPCTHTGPCNASTNCLCFQEEAYCERSCHCLLECERRWTGCTCALLRSGNLCGTNACKCSRAARECDPEHCECKADPSDHKCVNCFVQRGTPKETAVKTTLHGYGLFAIEHIAAREFILEYVGELVYEATVESRALLATHRKRNYIYFLNKDLNIDASAAGNNSRFINHAPTGKSNCQARTLYVHGEHRIGIFAIHDIAFNEELLIDYGEDFWPKEDSSIPTTE